MVTISGSVISFPPMSVLSFTPIHDAIATFDLEEITATIDGEVKVCGLLVENSSIQEVYKIVKRCMVHPTFVSFLLSLKDEGSAIGDLARDALIDDKVSKRWGFNKFMDHIVEMGACEKARLTAMEALARYSLL